MEFGTISEIVTAIASVVMALSVIVAALQLSESRANWVAENKRLKKQAAIDAAKIYIDNKRPETDLMLQFVNNACHLNSRILQDIEKFNLPRLPVSLLDDVRGCVEFYDPAALGSLAEKDGFITGVTAKHIIQLRWLMIDYLNTLETVLTYWWQGTANERLLELEFAFLRAQSDSARPVRHLVECYGETNFPAIAAFLRAGAARQAPEPDFH
ncbi:hypothetical protein [uncultured Maricaulis sp.]|uniref:hypothetical protein n=1 Tax=uncultured Maricaulis sp. TaxID=174710 RepID=UPI0030D94C2C|tara:strand:+ start:23733 stop:24368 length:636 start_codon:yes stop_codon:yes gene_type:complete